MRQKESVNGTIRGRLPDGTANPIDVHVGKRLKEARIRMGLSQEKLADEMGITFQQVQKYEKGQNRIGASRLWDLAQVLGEPIGYFYENIDETEQNQSPRKINSFHEDTNTYQFDDLTLTADDVQVISDYKKIRNPAVARTIAALIHSLSERGPKLPKIDLDSPMELIDE